MLTAKLSRIKLLLTDCDGVLTDGGVYYGEAGEALKKFDIRGGGRNRHHHRRVFSIAGEAG
jgi:3-deoxy-D-manno-octulosonate 8-phosphate phosphatase KdsC-like HAD superfamily phosphatase